MAAPAFTRRGRLFVPSPTPLRATRAALPLQGTSFRPGNHPYTILNKVINH